MPVGVPAMPSTVKLLQLHIVINSLLIYETMATDDVFTCFTFFNNRYLEKSGSVFLGELTNATDCLSECLFARERHGFVCKTAMWKRDTEDCVLSKYDRNERFDYYQIAPNLEIDMYENQCLETETLPLESQEDTNEEKPIRTTIITPNADQTPSPNAILNRRVRFQPNAEETITKESEREDKPTIEPTSSSRPQLETTSIAPTSSKDSAQKPPNQFSSVPGQEPPRTRGEELSAPQAQGNNHFTALPQIVQRSGHAAVVWRSQPQQRAAFTPQQNPVSLAQEQQDPISVHTSQQNRRLSQTGIVHQRNSVGQQQVPREQVRVEAVKISNIPQSFPQRSNPRFIGRQQINNRAIGRQTANQRLDRSLRGRTSAHEGDTIIGKVMLAARANNEQLDETQHTVQRRRDVEATPNAAFDGKQRNFGMQLGAQFIRARSLVQQDPLSGAARKTSPIVSEIEKNISTAFSTMNDDAPLNQLRVPIRSGPQTTHFYRPPTPSPALSHEMESTATVKMPPLIPQPPQPALSVPHRPPPQTQAQAPNIQVPRRPVYQPNSHSQVQLPTNLKSLPQTVPNRPQFVTSQFNHQIGGQSVSVNQIRQNALPQTPTATQSQNNVPHGVVVTQPRQVQTFAVTSVKENVCFMKINSRFLPHFVEQTLRGITMSECLNTCQSNTNFYCVSVNYDISQQTCVLNGGSWHLNKEALLPSSFDYYENMCNPPKVISKEDDSQLNSDAITDCFVPSDNLLLIELDATVSDVNSLEECQWECLLSRSKRGTVCAGTNWMPQNKGCMLFKPGFDRKLLATAYKTVYYENRCKDQNFGKLKPRVLTGDYYDDTSDGFAQ